VHIDIRAGISKKSQTERAETSAHLTKIATIQYLKTIVGRDFAPMYIAPSCHSHYFEPAQRSKPLIKDRQSRHRE
jgi:hypothetical protein